MKNVILSFILLFWMCGITCQNSTTQAQTTANAYQASYQTQDKSKSKQYALKAAALRQRGNYQGALLEYDNAISLDHSNYELWLRKALIYTTLKDWANAVKAMNEVVALKNNYIKGYLVLRKIHIQNRNYAQAITALDNAYKYDSEVRNKIRYKAEIIKLLEKTGQLHKAGKHIQQAKQLLGNNPKVLYYDAKYSNLNGDYQNAIRSAQSALDNMMTHEPQKTAGFYYELGYAYHHLGQYDEAQKHLRNANYGSYKSKIFKLTPTYHYKLAVAYYQIHQYKKCEDLLNRALEIKEDYTSAHDLKIRLAEKKTNQIELAKSLRESIAAEKDQYKQAQQLAQLCEIYYKAQNYSRALSAANRSLELYDNPSIALLKAMIYYQIEQNRDGIKVITSLLMEKGARNQHDKAKYYFALGLFYERIGNMKLAVNNYKKSDFGDFKYVASERLEKLKDVSGSL